VLRAFEVRLDELEGGLRRDTSLWTNPTVGGWIQTMPEAPGRPPGRDPISTLYLIRHAHTGNDGSRSGNDVITGWTDPPLDEKGRAQAVAMGKQLAAADLGINQLYCSDMTRCRETGIYVGKALGFAKALPSEVWRPWSMGTLEGQPLDECEEAIGVYVRDKPQEDIPGGESFNDFRARFLQGLFAMMRSPASPLPAPGNTSWRPGAVGIITHSRNLELARAWIEAAGPPSWEIVPDTFLAFDSYPGEVVCLHRDLNDRWSVERKRCEELQPAARPRERVPAGAPAGVMA